VARRGGTAPASWARRGGRAAARGTALVALSVHGHQAIPSATMPEAEEAKQRLAPGNIDLAIANIDITPTLRRKRGVFQRWRALDPGPPFISGISAVGRCQTLGR
jgi:hypothetical protein